MADKTFYGRRHHLPLTREPAVFKELRLGGCGGAGKLELGAPHGRGVYKVLDCCHVRVAGCRSWCKYE